MLEAQRNAMMENTEKIATTRKKKMAGVEENERLFMCVGIRLGSSLAMITVRELSEQKRELYLRNTAGACILRT